MAKKRQAATVLKPGDVAAISLSAAKAAARAVKKARSDAAGGQPPKYRYSAEAARRWLGTFGQPKGKTKRHRKAQSRQTVATSVKLASQRHPRRATAGRKVSRKRTAASR